jgi:hypothetical protein
MRTPFLRITLRIGTERDDDNQLKQGRTVALNAVALNVVAFNVVPAEC